MIWLGTYLAPLKIRISKESIQGLLLKSSKEEDMFYEVRVYRPNGQIKQKISQAELIEKHWKSFEKIESEIGLNSSGTKPVPAWVKTRLDLEYSTNVELNYKSSQG